MEEMEEGYFGILHSRRAQVSRLQSSQHLDIGFSSLSAHKVAVSSTAVLVSSCLSQRTANLGFRKPEHWK